jgi:hypothetical protein
MQTEGQTWRKFSAHFCNLFVNTPKESRIIYIV